MTQAQSRSEEPRATQKTKGPFVLMGLLVPLLSVTVALASVVYLYWRLMPPQTDTQTEEQSAQTQYAQTEEPAQEEQEYVGVQDLWLSSAVFSMGDRELDQQIKAFCDALSQDGLTASQNAYNVFTAVVWSDYEYRPANQKPSGFGWEAMAAKHYFEGGDPATGTPGKGDEYEFAAVIGYCLRYFGYSDAFAVPVVSETRPALVICTNENGEACVCDPSAGAGGWMVSRDYYNIVVENIEQDLDPVRAAGLTIEETDIPIGDGGTDTDTDTSY